MVKNEKHIKPGYHLTEVGIIPMDWKVERLDELAFVIWWWTPSTSNPDFWNGEINWFTPTEIWNKKYVNTSIRKITKSGLEQSSAKILPKGSILLTSRASIWDVAILEWEACTNQWFQSLVPIEWMNSDLLYYILLTKRNELLKNASWSTFLEISPNKVKAIKVSFPSSKSEQSKIAQALSDTDTLIASLDKLIEKKKAIKQGAMQNLLTWMKRLSGFSGEWKRKRLWDLANFYKWKGLPKSSIILNGKYKCIHYWELFTQYPERIELISSRTENILGAFLSRENDVLMPTSDVTPNWLAKASCLVEDNIILWGDILVIRFFENNIDGLFLSYLIRFDKEQIMRLVSWSTVYHLYGTDMSKYEAFFPPTRAEQSAIAQILSDIDSEISELEKKRDKYKQIKHGMMSELLTGNIRLLWVK